MSKIMPPLEFGVLSDAEIDQFTLTRGWLAPVGAPEDAAATALVWRDVSAEDAGANLHRLAASWNALRGLSAEQIELLDFDLLWAAVRCAFDILDGAECPVDDPDAWKAMVCLDLQGFIQILNRKGGDDA